MAKKIWAIILSIAIVLTSVNIPSLQLDAAEEPVGSPKTGDMGAPAYCAMCAASGAGTAALWLRRRGKRG